MWAVVGDEKKEARPPRLCSTVWKALSGVALCLCHSPFNLGNLPNVRKHWRNTDDTMGQLPFGENTEILR